MDEPFSTEPVTLIEEVFPQDTNALNTLFGGRLLSIMDTAAGVVSSKFAHRDFVTVSIDALKFKRPAFQGDLIEATATVIYTSTHTVGVHVVANRLNRTEWDRQEICSGLFFMVAIDSEMNPIPVPQLVPETDEQKKLWGYAANAKREMKESLTD